MAHCVPIIILDSLNDPEWTVNFPQDYPVLQTTDPEEFLAAFWASKRCACFIDEAGDAVGRYNVVMQKTATRGRHWGHSVHYISQRGVQIAPTVRDQCSHLFLLTTSMQDSKVHANEWNAPILAQAHMLKKGQFFHCTRFGEIKRGALFGDVHGTDTNTRNGGRELPRGTPSQSAAPQLNAAATSEEESSPGGGGRDDRRNDSGDARGGDSSTEH